MNDRARTRPGSGRPRPRSGRPRPRGAHADPARRAAYDVVHAVSARDAYANLVLGPTLREHGVSGRDAAFATELAHGTLRKLGTYDEVLAHCVDRALDRLDPEVLDLLRLGVHQLIGMRVATHAAVATTVDLTRSVVGQGPSGFVNAVLRKVARKDAAGWLAEIAPAFDTDPIGNLSAVHAHPAWIVETFRDALGGSLVETEATLRADNDPAAVTLVARPGRSTRDELVEAGAAPGRWSPYAAVLESGDPARIEAVADGRVGVQDEGSQLVTLALANVELDGPDRRWLDMCAGPGGKAALLAGLAADRGAGLVAAELGDRRARMVARALAGSDGVLGVVRADGNVPAWSPGGFDRVLLDAPCTGLGALRRRPESRWRRQPADVAALTALQGGLLRAALASVRVGGVVAYVTCSPHPAETTGVVAAVRADAPGTVEQIDARPLFAELPDLGPGPDVQLWPHRHGTDAMYLALLRRIRPVPAG